MDPRVLIAYLVQVAVWGSTWGVIKIGVTDVPPWIFAFDRSIIVALTLTAVALVLRLPFPREPRILALVAFSGAINSGICWALIFWAEQFVPSGPSGSWSMRGGTQRVYGPVATGSCGR